MQDDHGAVGLGEIAGVGDFVRHRATSDGVDAWQAWFGQLVPRMPAAAPREQVAGERGWVHLAPPTLAIDPPFHPLPWSFVLAPGTVRIGGAHYVVGSLGSSADKVGRRHPFVVYQVASRRWLERHLGDPRGWLFWLARLSARHIHDSAPAVAFTEQLEQLWLLHRPDWRERLGFSARTPDARACRAIVESADGYDPSVGLDGVAHLPWNRWPRCVGDGKLRMAFWKQDAAGRYVDATEQLPREFQGVQHFELV